MSNCKDGGRRRTQNVGENDLRSTLRSYRKGGLEAAADAEAEMVSSFLVLDFYCSRTAEISEQSRIEREARKRKSFDHD